MVRASRDRDSGRPPEDAASRDMLLLQAELDRYESRILSELRTRRLRIASGLLSAVFVALTLLVVGFYFWVPQLRPTEPEWFAIPAVVGTLLGAGLAAVGATYSSIRQSRESRAEYETTMSRAERGLNLLGMELQEKNEEIADLKRRIHELEVSLHKAMAGGAMPPPRGGRPGFDGRDSPDAR